MPRIGLASALAATLVVTSAAPLRVIRVTPESESGPTPEISVTFDRPVAGGLQGSVPAADVFSIQPEVPGVVEWRDPFTIRLLPDSALTPGAQYTVRVSDAFQAMDGNRLPAPYTHTFTVRRGTVLNGFPMRKEGWGAPRLVGVRPVLRFLVRPWFTNPQAFVAEARIRMSGACSGREIGLEFIDQRRMDDTDPEYFSWEEWHPRMDMSDDGRRVVEVRPVEDLPRDCAGTLDFPSGEAPSSVQYSWDFSTYGPLRVTVAACAGPEICPSGPVRLAFNNPVKGADVLRHVGLDPARAISVSDTSASLQEWLLDVPLEPRSTYALRIDAGLTDLFGQPLGSDSIMTIRTTGYGTAASYAQGRMVVERERGASLPVHHINADTLVVVSAAVPRRFEGAFIASRWGWGGPWDSIAVGADTLSMAVPNPLDQGWVTAVPLARDAVTGTTLTAVRVGARLGDSKALQGGQPIALTQVTDLGVHARVGSQHGIVWVTDVSDGTPRAGARVTVHGPGGNVRAEGVTDERGLVEMVGLRRASDEEACISECYGFEGYVAAELEGDRALVGLSRYDPDLAPWRFDIPGAWGADELPIATAVFTERGIYRPGETVHGKVIIRRGPLGDLTTPAGDSVRIRWLDRERQVIRDTVRAVSAFGTVVSELTVDRGAAVGSYTVDVQAVAAGEWTDVGSAGFRVAEYRPPEFLVDAVADRSQGLSGDTATVVVSGRYLFGAPMVGAPAQWTVRLDPIYWGLDLPGADGFSFGAGYGWWDDGRSVTAETTASGVDSLGSEGTVDLAVPLSGTAQGLPLRATLQATVTDANRQASTAAASVVVHPASFYLGARTPSDSWFWTAGSPVRVDVIAVQPDGTRQSGVRITGQVSRREWHRVRRVRDGLIEEVGQWVTDTVATCSLTSAEEPVPCEFTPPAGGSYRVDLEAEDSRGRVVRTELYRWAVGEDWVPWNDESKLNMDVIADRETYDIGDTATVLFASPFTDAEAWVTVEREQVLTSHRLRLTSGATTFKLPITEALAPNAFVSIIVAKGRTAEPSGTDDPGRPAIRVGYAQIRVVSEVKRLAVDVEPIAQATAAGRSSTDPVTYEPGDTARFDVRVRRGDGAGEHAEVTLWAVDEGVLALTGYSTPDPVDLIYRERGLGVRLGSNLTNIAAQVPEGQKGRREPGGGGGGDAAAVLRSRFQTTAFFLGSIETDSTGSARVEAKLPDNLTTFRVMAVAVTTGDRYGSGESKMLVTRPLLARPALPRFVRATDSFSAGVVINQRLGIPLDVVVRADASGIQIGDTVVRSALDPLRAGEARFDFLALEGDSARFEFSVRGEPTGQNAGPVSADLRDAVRVALPVQPSFHPLASSVTGALGSAPEPVSIPLRPDVDPDRSWVELSFGTTPLAVVRAMERRLNVYPYQCTEQITSAALAMLAGYRLDRVQGEEDEASRARIQAAVRMLERRQRSDGALGYWSASDWSSAWLSTYAGRVLIEARDLGFDVDSGTVVRLTDFVKRRLGEEENEVPVFGGWNSSSPVYVLSERLMAADFLSRASAPDLAVENDLLSNVSLMRWEDQVLLAETLARSGRLDQARPVLDAAWESVTLEGAKATAPEDGENPHYFNSRVRGTARLLAATLRVRPEHRHLGALMESLLDRARADTRYWWNTQDYAFAAMAAADMLERTAGAEPRPIRIRGGGRVVADLQAAAGQDTTFALSGLVFTDDDGEASLQMALGPGPGGSGTNTNPVYYVMTVHEVPTGPAVEPVIRGITVERWYETLDTGEPVTRVDEGDLVRVGLRITLPQDRQFVVLDDPLPAGLEAVDLSLRTVQPEGARFDGYERDESSPRWFGSWSSGLWSPFEHQEIRDDRVVYSSQYMTAGSHTTSYVARATTAGTFVVPPAHAEEMYNPGVNGRTGGSSFTVVRGSER